jgi:Zn-dependent metalloprotease
VATPTATLVAEPTARGGLEPAWLVVVPAREPRGDWTVVVSARSGDVLEAFDAITQVNGSALTYAPNPVQQTGNTDLRDNADADSAALTAARATITLTDLNASTNLLRGTYVDTASSAVTGCTLPYVPGQATSATRAYSYTRSPGRV